MRRRALGKVGYRLPPPEPQYVEVCLAHKMPLLHPSPGNLAQTAPESAVAGSKMLWRDRAGSLWEPTGEVALHDDAKSMSHSTASLTSPENFPKWHPRCL